MTALLARIATATRNARETGGDFAAQISANRGGLQRLGELIVALGKAQYRSGLAELNDYGERLARAALAEIPEGEYRFCDVMDDDGLGHLDIAIAACVRAGAGGVHVDFTGTSAQVPGNINCPLSVAAAAVYYVLRCLMPDHTPACAGAFRPISLACTFRLAAQCASPRGGRRRQRRDQHAGGGRAARRAGPGAAASAFRRPVTAA